MPCARAQVVAMHMHTHMRMPCARAQVVADKAAANAALLHMQLCYRADPRCFFSADDEADVASRTLDLAKLAWPRVFSSADAAAGSAFGRQPRPVNRPRLTDGLFFDLLRDTRLLREVLRQSCLSNGSPLLPNARPQVLFDALKEVNRVMSEAGPPGSVSQRTFAACASRHGGCFLGLYRRDETGVRTMERLRRARVVPDDASCQLDTVGE